MTWRNWSKLPGHISECQAILVRCGIQDNHEPRSWAFAPPLHDGDVVLVDLARRSPTPPGIFVLNDGMGLLAKRLEHIPNSDPPRVRIISDNRFYVPYECTSEEINIIGRIRWFAREI